MRLRLIVNPSAGAGRARKELPSICASFERVGLHCDIAETSHAGHASELAAQAIRDAVDVLAVMGGDGTLNEVAQAFVDPHGRPVIGPELALVPFGTGGDFRRSFGWNNDVAEAVQRIAGGRSKAIDLALTTSRGESGQDLLRCFINVGSFGISGLVTRAVNRSSKWLGGRLTFYMAAARATLTYKNCPITLRVDGEQVHSGPVYLAAFANGQYFGGGMRVAPDADPGDGLLNCVVHGDLSRAAAYTLTGSMYDGSHLQRPLAYTWRGRHFEAIPTSNQEPSAAIELDGETPGHLPLRINVLPQAITLRI